MSLFGRKEREQLVEADAEIAELGSQLAEANARCAELVRQLQEVDQALWNFSQSTMPDQARKAISPAMNAMHERKVTESRRIEAILIPELKRTYGR